MEEIEYKVGAFTVELGVDERGISEWECECEIYHRNRTMPSVRDGLSEKCKHIRKAELFHIYNNKVEQVNTSE